MARERESKKTRRQKGKKARRKEGKKARRQEGRRVRGHVCVCVREKRKGKETGKEK